MAEIDDIIRRNNNGVFIQERDYSIYNITPFTNQVNLVIGSSKKGAFNVPILVTSPENFIEIYGDIDYSLERKGSYFHRTVLNMLTRGSVICLNIRPVDKELDNYNWVALSTSSDNKNSNTRTNSVEDFYDIGDGFWKRSTDKLIDVSKKTIPDASGSPFVIANQSSKKVSVLSFKSNIKGFDRTVEDWYNGKYPEYLHPKSLISDYIVDFLIVEGAWDNYKQLSVHPKWGKYFEKNGIRKDKLSEFLNESEVKLVKKYTASLIPYFRDKADKDFYLPSIVNNDINENGVLVSFDSNVIETDIENGKLDLVGSNLTDSKSANIDFLSYKRNLSDYLIVDEKFIDQAGNSFGNPIYNLQGSRTQLLSEGNVVNCILKTLILSATSNVKVRPLETTSNEAYVVINGKKIHLSSDIEDVIALEESVKSGFKFCYVVLVDSEGVKFRSGKMVSINNEDFLPYIDPKTEMVLGYYVISQNESGTYDTELFGVAIDNDGFINPFRDSNSLPNETKVSFSETDYQWQQKLVFENSFNPNYQDYQQLRIYHLWYWLSDNLIEGKSLIIDTEGNKQKIDTVEIGHNDNSRYIKMSIEDRNYDISSVDNINNGGVGIYIQDVEFLAYEENKLQSQIEPLEDSDYGIIGENSDIYEAYNNGEINDGDPFFWSIGEEFNIRFKNNTMIFDDGYTEDYSGKKIIVQGSKSNDGLYSVIANTVINGKLAIVLDKTLTDEFIEQVNIFDAETPKIINLYFVDGKLKSLVENYEGDVEELYDKLYMRNPDTKWNKSLEVEEILTQSKILVDAERYSSLETGNYLLGEEANTDGIKRNWVRIVDITRYDQNPNLLLIEADSPIKFNRYEGDIQTKYLLPIDRWVDTLDFKVLKPHVVREQSLPNNTEERLQEVMNMIGRDTKLSQSLTSDRMDWRYLIDSYGMGLTPESKKELAMLCERKGRAFGFINMPSIKQFRNSSSTIYKENGVFSTELLLKGGDKKTNGGISYSIPKDGASHVCYITPFVTISDNGRPYNVPPSSYVAMRYMRKSNNTKVYKPHDIMAGVMEGRLNNVIGLEYEYTDEQLGDLNLFRAMAIKSYENTIFFINNENTAYDRNSALGYVHNRETLIELENSMIEMLNQYQWSEITDENTEAIVQKANNICDRLVNNSAIAEYVNEFVEDNELTDAQIGVLNTYVELVAGMGKILLRLNIMRTNSISGGDS